MNTPYSRSHGVSDAPVPGLTTFSYFAAAFFTLTLLTDIAYIQTTVLMWKDFSSWLLFFGLIAAAVATLLWLVDLAVHRHRPMGGIVVLNVAVLICALLNSLLHAGDGWTAIVPWGVGLSALTCLLMLGSAVLRRRATVHRPYL
ncbi:DUF2231 domain-containing protein [Pseudotabrizicola sp. 4114]|uniref:DUF2231 domain-containing protein n=1 Tax=Pseudotabrizicola sp. 4114 TaxID=2817731 RepID=UPI002863BFE0|nr:putative membrane protein [Pseudorhodobacter sp. 4114]